jgi:hypothetical protein
VEDPEEEGDGNACDEGDDEDERPALVRDVVARRDEDAGQGRLDDEECEPEAERQAAQARTARSVSPERSAFEMNPRAWLVWMRPL